MADEAHDETQDAPAPQMSPLEEYKAGLISKNEYREMKGLDPVDNDKFADEEPEAKARGGKTVKAQTVEDAPAFNQTDPGDSELKAFAHWVRTGDVGGIKHLIAGEAHPSDVKNAQVAGSPLIEVKASNDTDMNIGTAADGGNTVPTGHFNGIIARRDESMLAEQLGVRNIPGQGTTVNVPVDDENDGEFVSTGEASEFDRDAPAIGQVQMTLAKYTKRVQMSYELMQDEASRLMAFLNDFVGRGMAKTHNDLLVAEITSNGTGFDTFAGSDAIAAGEPEAILADDDLGFYLDDTGSVSWLMRNSTLWAIKSITGNERQYDIGLRQGDGLSLLGYPVALSNKVDALGSSNNPVIFGNFNFVGYREDPGFTVLRDPYSRASFGQTVFHYYFRTVYSVLQSEAIGYGSNAA